jgi:GNAT superfamily N-acetyltransferase
MTRHSLYKTHVRERPGTFPARTTPLRRLAGWLWPERDDRLGWDDQPGCAMLRDGSRVPVRPVRSTDALLLAEGFARLSERSRRMRFLGKKEELSAGELRYYADVDHHDHEALVALDPADGRGAGVARYVRDADDPQAAEIALTIADDWQGRGLGTVLLARLSDRGRQEGICRFTAVVSYDNVPMGMLLRSVGAVETDRGFGTVEYDIALTRTEDYSLDWWFRCVDDGSVFSWR